MATHPTPSSESKLLGTLGDSRWLRAHVSVFAVGAVLLVMLNLLIGGSRLWSLTAIGIWSMFLLVHVILVLIARLSTQLLADDDEEVVLLPIRDAIIVDPRKDPTSTWTSVTPADSSEKTNAENTDTVSWQVATDVAQARWQTEKSEETTE